RIVIRGGKHRAVATVAETRQHDMSGTRPLRRHFVKRLLTRLDAGETLPGIAPPRPVIDALRHRLAELAVARDVDAERALFAHHVHDCRPERRFKHGWIG